MKYVNKEWLIVKVANKIEIHELLTLIEIEISSEPNIIPNNISKAVNEGIHKILMLIFVISILKRFLKPCYPVIKGTNIYRK